MTSETGKIMQIIRFSDLQDTPWKNGGGITREIAAKRSGKELIWRLSIADVSVDGRFSKFEGLSRILTVIEGHGMELIGPHASLHADYAVPLHFEGSLEINARLKHGPLRDFNLIYNPAFVKAMAHVIKHCSNHHIEAKIGSVIALHCIVGSITIGKTELLHKGDTALIDSGEIQFEIPEGAGVLMTTLQTEASN
jgi:uncharacterized protein